MPFRLRSPRATRQPSFGSGTTANVMLEVPPSIICSRMSQPRSTLEIRFLAIGPLTTCSALGVAVGFEPGYQDVYAEFGILRGVELSLVRLSNGRHPVGRRSGSLYRPTRPAVSPVLAH